MKADLGLYNDSFLPQMTGRCGLNLLWLAQQDACIPRGLHMVWSNAPLLHGDLHVDLVTQHAFGNGAIPLNNGRIICEICDYCFDIFFLYS